jgi:hypothetical protein
MKKKNSINGLILYSLYSSGGNIVLFISISIILGVIYAVTGNESFSFLLPGIAVTTLPCTLMLTSHKESSSKWNRFQLTMPVKRKDVIASKYLGLLLLLLVGTAIFGMFTIFAAVLHSGEDIVSSVLFIFSLLAGVALLSGGLFYPAVYVFSDESKSEALSIICILGAFGINAGVLWMGDKVGLASNSAAVVCLIVSAVLFALSYSVASKKYSQKDL